MTVPPGPIKLKPMEKRIIICVPDVESHYHTSMVYQPSIYYPPCYQLELAGWYPIKTHGARDI